MFQASAERFSRGGSLRIVVPGAGSCSQEASPWSIPSLQIPTRASGRSDTTSAASLGAGCRSPGTSSNTELRCKSACTPGAPRGRTVDHPEHSMQYEQRPSSTARSRPHTFAMRRSGVRIPAAPLTTRDQPLRGSVPCSSGHGPGPLHGRFRSRRYREAMVLGADACRAGWVGLLLTSSTRGRGMRRVHLRLPGRRRRDARPARAGRRRYAGRVAAMARAVRPTCRPGPNWVRGAPRFCDRLIRATLDVGSAQPSRVPPGAMMAPAMSLLARMDRLPFSRSHYALLVIGGLGYTFDGGGQRPRRVPPAEHGPRVGARQRRARTPRGGQPRRLPRRRARGRHAR